MTNAEARFNKSHIRKSLDDVRLHVFSLKGVPMQLPQSFNSDVRNGMTGRINVLGYRLAALVADVSRCEGPGCLTNIDEDTRLTGDGIYQVVALTRESPLDVHVTIGTSNGGVSAQVGACFAPVSGVGECAWCGVGMATEAGVYENLS